MLFSMICQTRKIVLLDLIKRGHPVIQWLRRRIFAPATRVPRLLIHTSYRRHGQPGKMLYAPLNDSRKVQALKRERASTALESQMFIENETEIVS